MSRKDNRRNGMKFISALVWMAFGAAVFTMTSYIAMPLHLALVEFIVASSILFLLVIIYWIVAYVQILKDKYE